MVYIRRIYFTLLEMLTVLAILAIIAGFIGVNIAKATREQRFNTEVSLIVNQLRLAQDLMLIMNSNLTLTFKAHSSGIEYNLKSAVEFPKEMKAWEKELTREHAYLTTIQRVNFEDQLEKGAAERNTEVVKFQSGGDRMSYGVMRLSTSEKDENYGALTRYICLPGYPAPIFSTSIRPSNDECYGKDEGFAEQLSQRTFEELRARNE